MPWVVLGSVPGRGQAQLGLGVSGTATAEPARVRLKAALIVLAVPLRAQLTADQGVQQATDSVPDPVSTVKLYCAACAGWPSTRVTIFDWGPRAYGCPPAAWALTAMTYEGSWGRGRAAALQQGLGWRGVGEVLRGGAAAARRQGPRLGGGARKLSSWRGTPSSPC